MIDIETSTIYKCPYCDKEYEKESTARQCAVDCVLETVEPCEIILKYHCPKCSKVHLSEEEAKECITSHKYEDLIEAASQPGQLKLSEVLLEKSQEEGQR